jgi:hypothetical protein
MRRNNIDSAKPQIKGIRTPVEQTDKSIKLDDADLVSKFPLALILGMKVRGVVEVLSLWRLVLKFLGRNQTSLNVATTAGIVIWECYRVNRLRLLPSNYMTRTPVPKYNNH